MVHVLVLIVVFTSASGVTTETRFQEFGSRAACESARGDIGRWIEGMKGPLAREFYVQCFPKG